MTSRFCETVQNELLSSGLHARSISTSRQCLTASSAFALKPSARWSKGRHHEGAPDCVSGRGARARTDTVRSRAASGIMSTGITAGARGAAARLGQERAGNARELPRPRKPGLESKSRGLETSVRAAVERREASASRRTRGLRPKRRWMATSAAWRGPTGQLRLPALRLPSFFEAMTIRSFGRQTSGARASRERERTSFALPAPLAAPSPRVRGEGWVEGAFPRF